MSKKTVLILSLILSIFSLVYLFSDYYGLIRYVNLHIFSTKGYTKKYPKLEKADKERVVVLFELSLAKKNLKPFINSLLDQTVRVDELVAIGNGRTKEHATHILSVYHGSLMGYIKQEPECYTKIIVVDPNMIYGKDFIQVMVEKSNKSPDKVIYGKRGKPEFGVLLKPSFFEKVAGPWPASTVCEGTHTYRRL